MDDKLRITTLGGLSIRLGGERVTGFASRKVEALLVYLACTGRPHSREVLADLLWDDRSQQRAMSNLRVVLSSLRKQLGSYVTITRETAAINQEADTWLDAAELEQRLSPLEGQAELASAEQAARAADAVNLYQGDFLEGFHLRQARGFEEWLTMERERLRLMVLDTLRRLVGHHLQQTTFHEGIPLARHLLRLDPLDEGVHRQLMQLLAYDDQRAAALEQYESCRHVLAEELGVEPAAETAAWYETILTGELKPSSQLAMFRSRPQMPRLPVLPSPLIGREREMEELHQLLVAGDVRFVSIVGPGGIGKTHLAIAVAHALMSDVEHGATFVNLAPVRSVDSILSVVAQALRFSLPQSAEKIEAQRQLLSYLRRRQLLLVIDNFEHLLEGSLLLIDILQAAPGVKVLVTSRERLKLQAEQVYPLHGLAFSRWRTVTEAESYPAIQLFLRHVHRIRPGFRIRQEHLDSLWRICRYVQGMPLGIILAAAWVEVLSLAEIADEIGASLDFLEADYRDVPERQRSMRAVFESTWQRLTDQEQRQASTLSIFAGGFTVEAARQVIGATPRDLVTLIDKSLLTRTDSGRFIVHELLRQFAAEKLAQDQAIEEMARDRHAVYYCNYVAEREPRLKGAQAESALAEIEADIDNIQSAWYWAVRRGQFQYLGPAAFGLNTFYTRFGRYPEGLQAFKEAVDTVTACISLTNPVRVDDLRVLVHLLATYSMLQFEVGANQLAEKLCRDALLILERPELSGQDMRREKALVLLGLSRVYEWLNRHAETKELLEESSSLFRIYGDNWYMAGINRLMGGINLRQGNSEMGIQHFTKALHLYQDLGNQRESAATEHWIGYLRGWQGNFAEAEQLLNRSLMSFREIDDHRLIAQVLGLFGQIVMFRGEFQRALSLLSESIRSYEELGIQDWLAIRTKDWCWANVLDGHYERAERKLKTSLEIFQASEYPSGQGYCLFLAGCIRLARHHYHKAYQSLQESMAIFRAIGQEEEQSMAQAVLAAASCQLGDITESRQMLTEALQMAGELNRYIGLIHVLPSLAFMFVKSDDVRRAVELYALANCQPLVSNSRWFADVFIRYVQAAAADLPSDVVETAKARGRSLDLWQTAAELLHELEG